MADEEVITGDEYDYSDEESAEEYDARIRKRRRGELAALAALALALAYIIWWILTNTVIVPNVIGLDKGEAAIRLRAGELKVGEITTVRSGRFHNGEIAQQGPLPGMRALRGTNVDLALARGASGDTDGSGDGNADQYTSYSTTNWPDWEPDASTQPEPRTYSTDYPGDVVPMVQALTKKAAIKKLEAEGYTAKVKYGPNSSGPGKGYVFFQYPAPFSSEKPGTRVEIWVSTGGPDTGKVCPVPREAE